MGSIYTIGNRKKIRDYIAKAPDIKTVVHWYDLPIRTIIKLDSNFQKYLLRQAINKTHKGLRKELAKAVGLTRHQIRLYSNLKSNFSVRSLMKIASFADVSFDKVEKHIVEIGRKNTIRNPKLPFRLNTSEGVALRSIVNSEGYISKQHGTTMHIRVPEIEMLQSAIKFAKTIFGEFIVKIKPTKRKNASEIFLPSEMADVLVISGLTRGKKSIQNPFVPKDVIAGSLEMQQTYLQWSFAGEMECCGKVIKLTRNVDVSELLTKSFKDSLPKRVTYKGGIPFKILEKLSKKPPNLLIGESLLLKNFGIFREPYITNLWKAKNGRVSAAWTLPVTNKREIKILFNEIKLPLTQKSKAIERTLKSYKRI